MLQLFGPVRLLGVLVKVSEDVYVHLRFVMVMNVSMGMGVVMVYMVMNFAYTALAGRVASICSVFTAFRLARASVII